MELRKENRVSFEKRPQLGPCYRYKFKNGYGASVIVSRPGWELAVLKWNGDKWDLVYNTAITDDVISGLEISEVNELLEKIEQL